MLVAALPASVIFEPQFFEFFSKQQMREDLVRMI